MIQRARPLAAFRNRCSLAGIVLAGIAFAIETVLLIVDISHGHGGPLLGVVTYLIVPVVLVGCVGLILVGAAWNLKKRAVRPDRGTVEEHGKIGRLQLMASLLLFAVVATVALVAGFRAYHFVESVTFCGAVCHPVMKPQYTTFQDSPHSSTTCTECHVGPGVAAFVRAKISGLQEVYAFAFDNFHRPLPPPVKNLRPARETCRTCHWPQKFFGAVLRTWTYYLSDEENSPWTIKMLLKTGGGDPRHGPVEGIHWHMEGVNDVEYIATDERRMNIPWVRMTDQDGKVTVFQSTDEDVRLTPEQVAAMPKRRMDCMDCHNRPTHGFLCPNEAMDLAMSSDRIDATMPEIKYTAADLLGGDYETESEALAAIETGLRETYEGRPDLDATVQAVQNIYRRNMFPDMNVRWDAYPDHSAHKITPGCFRCHDGHHVSESGEVIRRDCEICHTILAQGPGLDPDGFTPHGVEFKHPEDIDGEWKTERCDTCHTGSP